MDASSDQMSSETRTLTCHNQNTSEQLHTLDPRTAHFELSEKANQIGSEFLDNEQRILSIGKTSSVIDEKSPIVSDSMTGNSVILLPARPQSDLHKSCQIGDGSCLQHGTLVQADAISMDASSDQMGSDTKELTCHNQNSSEKLHTIDLGTAHFELSEKTNQVGSEFVDNEQRALGTGETCSFVDEKSPKVSDTVIGNSVIKLPAQPQCDLDESCQAGEGSCLQSERSDDQDEPVESSDTNEQSDPPYEDIAEGTSSDYLERNTKRATHVRLGNKDKKTPKSLKKKYVLRSLGSSDRVLRSRTQEKAKPPELNTNLVNVDNDGKKTRGRKKKDKGRGEGVTDEFSRIRARLRYFLKRVSYEQNLIDAYSGEGWKGYSMEKLKPEKELQRAKSEILQLKLKIRDLFRQLDILCAEGRLPESLFDSEGEISSEDIFCAKCRSKDLTTGNDIILCDGACDRGFHQFCLEPPLLTENIPADDEGWLCPGCDCKDDCFDILNDSLGTKLTISDAWERVFPEAAAAAGNKVDNNLGLPSDDSDDDDYNPDVKEDEEVEEGKSSSDESENSSASEEKDASRNEDPYLGLPSEDSEDNDYDPNVTAHDKDVAEESSSSDFTSDSEDLGDVIKGNTFSGQDNDPLSASSSLQLDSGQEACSPVSGKRQIESLPFSYEVDVTLKLLYSLPACLYELAGETYQNADSDTSDDEDWTATDTSSRKKKFAGKRAPVSPNGKASILDHVQKETAHTPRTDTRRNRVENTDNSPTESFEGSKSAGSNDKKASSSTYKRLGDDAVKVLYKNFKENQYPDRAKKESLAREVGLTFRQVSKWFENARHSLRVEASAGKKTSQQATSSEVENEGAFGNDERDSKLATDEGNVQTPSSGKRKLKPDPQESDTNMDIDSAAKIPGSDSPRISEVQRSHKKKTRKRK
ncbi:homeobox protein HAT3.1-like [Senna tora]|uniref:Homeobox protein HAT3.1-like n=1 Tax=Senna tora TaxID=362788 RepID=A0A834X9L6_9FABA|nr:homeobox protein HAT3.1-like [Senna tora]